MMRRVFVLISLLATAVPTAGSVAEGAADSQSSPDRFLVASTPSYYVTRIETFRQGLRDLGT